MICTRFVAGAILALGIAVNAGAQSVGASDVAGTQPSELQADSKHPGICGPFYPSMPELAGVQGTTLLLVRVTQDGAMKDPEIIQSSRDSDLDEAALACIANAPRSAPLLHDGKPIEASWVVRVVWQLYGPSFWQFAPAAGAANSCTSSYPAFAVSKHPKGTTRLSYRIATDGSVKVPVVTRSSGSTDLDRAALACVSAFSYWPATHDGQPVELDRTIDVDWNLERR
ncbi:MAG TPA: energy transducer TonB [Rhizomicrobium sp.]|nr:energy transducer TonB [Rhizomicrobium sp.]